MSCPNFSTMRFCSARGGRGINALDTVSWFILGMLLEVPVRS